MGELTIIQKFTAGILLCSLQSIVAAPNFNSSEIAPNGSEIIFCDLDGDGLKDAVLLDGSNLSILFQESNGSFSREPQQRYRAEKAGLFWPARLGTKAESLLCLTSEGVSELCFTNRSKPPLLHPVIKQPTIIPEELEKRELVYFPLSARTDGDWPLLLVPVPEGLEVWRHMDTWQRAEIIEHGLDAQLHPTIKEPGYTRSVRLQLSIGDLNRDRREDLILCREAAGLEYFSIYLQQSNGFSATPDLVYTNKSDWRTVLAWTDVNGDGRTDLIKSTFLDEPFFVPGMRSGKVLVGVYLADNAGHIPTEPQFIFRKHDWSTALPIADLDGDGFMDMVLGYIPLNAREGFRKALTAQQIDLSLKFYFFRPGAGYAKEPDCQRDLLIHFYNDLFMEQERRLYYEQFVNLNGDFNGDGKKDLLVADQKNEISVYFFISREKGFSAEPDIRFKCPDPVSWWRVEDLNGDGTSDLVVRTAARFRIFVSSKPK